MIVVSFFGRHSCTIAACTALVSSFGYFCAEYVPRYRVYHVQREISTNDTIVYGDGSGSTKGTADGTSRPNIESPITFLLVNFVYSYAVLVILVRLYDLYAWPTGPKAAQRLSCGGYRTIGNHAAEPCETDPAEPCETDPAEPCKTDPAEPCETDPAEPSVGRTRNDFGPRTAHRISAANKSWTSGVGSGQMQWDGDWNMYWNGKRDF